MSIVSIGFRLIATIEDSKRDKGLQFPEDVVCRKDIRYTNRDSIWELADVYYPKGTTTALPVIVNVHGGGWVYGRKENYMHYCAFLAQQGFTVVNMNYHLAPKKKFPTQLQQINDVMCWMQQNPQQYFMDLSNVFLVGDSAGAHMVTQYALILSNPDYAKLFPFALPKEIVLRAVGLNSGIYQIQYDLKKKKVVLPSREPILRMFAVLINEYLGKYDAQHALALDFSRYMTSGFPPAYIMTASNDFLKEDALPMHDLLKKHGVDAAYHCYGKAIDKHMKHACHLNIKLENTKQMNIEELAFFKQNILQKSVVSQTHH